MKQKTNKYFRSATIINEGRKEIKNVLVKGNRITKITNFSLDDLPFDTEIINCEHKLLLPGVIDVHVHFRQPGFEYKGDMQSESKAAVAGGVTTVFDMPNTNPPATTIQSLKDKILLARQSMLCNYGFFFGITNDNVDEALRLQDNSLACGLKVFLGSSTGNMLVDDSDVLDRIFSSSPLIISAHCEDEKRIMANTVLYKKYYSEEEAKTDLHPFIRDVEACFNSTSYAISLAKKYNTNLHVAHLSTEKEIALFNDSNIVGKRITVEVSPSHLWFYDRDYRTKGNLIKCNPSIKSLLDRDALRNALKNNFIDIVATDHAPHLMEEKQKPYFQAPSGIPSIQHSLLIMLELARQNVISEEQVIEKMCHNPAIRFSVKDRGFINEGSFADLVIVNPQEQTFVTQNHILYKCHWSPIEGTTFSNRIEQTFVNGVRVFDLSEITNI